MEEEKIIPEPEVTEEPEEVTQTEVLEETAQEITEETTEELTEESTEEATEETAEEQAPKQVRKFSAGKLALAISAMVLVMALLTGALLYGAGYRWEDFFPENNVMLKDSYTVSDTAVAKDVGKVVATMGGKQLTNGELQLYYWSAVQGFLNQYATSVEDLGLYLDEPLDQQMSYFSEELTWQQYFLEMALDNWSYYAMMQILAEQDAQYVPDQEMLDYIAEFPQQLANEAEKSGVESVSEYLKKGYGAGTDDQAVANYMETMTMGVAYEAEIANRVMPTQEQLEAWYAENGDSLEAQGVGKSAGHTVNIRHILVRPESDAASEDGYSDEAWEACRAKAQKIYDDWMAGEATEETFAAFAKEFSEDGNAQSGGLYENVPKGYMVEPFENWMFEEGRQVGDHGLVQTEFGYHVMFYSGSNEIWVNYATNEYMSEEMSKIVEDAAAKWDVEVDFDEITLGYVDLVGEEE